MYYRARWYDPQLGKFLNDDPIGFGAGDANVSRYVGNSSVNLSDPTGLQPPKSPVIELSETGRPYIQTTNLDGKKNCIQIRAVSIFVYMEDTTAAALEPNGYISGVDPANLAERYRAIEKSLNQLMVRNGLPHITFFLMPAATIATDNLRPPQTFGLHHSYTAL